LCRTKDHVRRQRNMLNGWSMFYLDSRSKFSIGKSDFLMQCPML
jgi:hypothetical protein